MRHSLVPILLLALALAGCDRLLGDDDPARGVVAPIAPPMIVVRTNAPSGVALFVDARSAGALTDGRRLQLDPGTHVFEARRQNEVVARAERTLAAGDEAEVALNVTVEEPVAPEIAELPAAGPRSATVTIGPVSTDRGADGERVASLTRALRARVRAIQSCYERVLEDDATAAGSAELHLTVQPTGTVSDVASEGSAPPVAAECATRVAARLRLPPSSTSGASRASVSVSFAPPVPAAAPPDRETPSRTDVVTAMNEVTPAIRSCGDGAGLVPVRFDFRGADGSVRSATASGSASLAVRSCVEAAARQARLPPFRREAFTVSYPFRL